MDPKTSSIQDIGTSLCVKLKISIPLITNPMFSTYHATSWAMVKRFLINYIINPLNLKTKKLQLHKKLSFHQNSQWVVTQWMWKPQMHENLLLHQDFQCKYTTNLKKLKLENIQSKCLKLFRLITKLSKSKMRLLFLGLCCQTSLQWSISRVS